MLNGACISRSFALALLALLAASCATPLGPGFHAERELLEVRFAPGSPPHLEVRATFTLKNSGNATLDSIDVSLPGEKDSGRSNLLITVDGASVSPRPLAAPLAAASANEPASAHHIPLAAPWPQKTTRTVVVSYQLVSSPGTAQRFGLGASSFFLSTDGWFPQLRAPKSLFAKGSGPAKRFDLSVFVPQDFLVHAAGRPRGKKRRAAESEFRFRIAEDDFRPFVVAGRYHEQKLPDSDSTILFWTFPALSQGPTARIGAHLAASLHSYREAFGPLAKHASPVYIVEVAGRLDTLLGRTFPGGILVDQEDVANDEFADLADIFLARLWFGQSLSPRPEIGVLLGPAAAAYAGHVAAGDRAGNKDRSLGIADLLKQYDALQSAAAEQPLGNLPISAPPNQRILGLFKGALFFFALEDACGKQYVHHALARLIASMRGEEVGIHDLRAALEAETGKDLGEFFRVWLNQPGIPAAFRSRYAEQKMENRK